MPLLMKQTTDFRGKLHQTNNLDKFFTDETSMAMIASKEHV
jgi:hypothetical protein